jgi:hypothetical protein
MKGTIYGNGLPRGTQAKKGWEALMCQILTMKKTVIFEAPPAEKCVERMHRLLTRN